MKFKFIPTLIYLCLLPVLLALGAWQLDRSQQKRGLIESQAQALASEILPLSPLTKNDAETLRYRQAEAVGRYDVAHQFLLDNQISEGKAGYFVLTPFILAGKKQAVLVNRGWVPLNPDRSILPDLQISQIEAMISGRINNFPSVGIRLAGAEIPAAGWPAVVQVVDSEVLAKKLGYPLFPFQLELAKELPDGFKRDWHTSTIMQPEQHTAYAFQWFALALTLTILFIWYGFKNNDAQSKK
ncbi:MAG: SURF1 family protein [Methylobacter sp.]|nr:SURF1 family protein [Methylobacter sp.]MDP2098974.1 SURF1 family protein [Methylobacter sp.]MDP2427519.1 SURF1 family protein [Methylobacter sp.]MDP3056804.1 SURF1 family protein [Methylobacter sp.]MDP3364023.1 SURF1 family protein [Methylobacter sp.]